YSLIGQLATGSEKPVNVRAATLGLSGIVDSLWQEFLTAPEEFDRTEAVETCRHYLQNLLPGFSTTQPVPPQVAAAPEDDGLPRTLPAWTYCSQEHFDREIKQIFKPAWQLVCHINDVPNPGDYFTFTGLGERAFVLHGEDGALRAFHNVCPHRAHAVVQGETGNCPGLIRCPYHSWGFSHAGELKAIAAAKTFPPFDNGKFGLRPLEMEIFMGLIFIRFVSGGPSVAERYAPYVQEIGAHKLKERIPITPMHDKVLNADWKNVWDNYLEDYHFPTGHPGLFGLMTPDYAREPDDATRTIRLSHEMRDEPRGSWSVTNYGKLLPDLKHLPKELRRRWSYFFMYPAVSLDVYPDVMDFFHVVPIEPGKCRLRVGTYGMAHASRELEASRYLAGRIGWQVHNEDVELIESVQGGLASSAYDTGLLGEKEIATYAFQRWAASDLPADHSRSGS
ncbi:MAG: SRPBCC family protein, partial [Hyphomicrobiales bacterium]